MRAKIFILAVLVAAVWGMIGFTPGIAGGGGGGVFQDLLPSHPAYKYVVYLLDKGIITVDPSGTFRADESLTRGTGAIWIAKAVQYLEGQKPAVDVQGLTQKISSLEGRVRQVEQDIVQVVREVQTLKSSVSSLSTRVSKLEQQGPAQVQGLAGKMQLALIVGITGVVLSLAALALYFFG
jgi:uncharacterized protein YoxC